MFTKILQPHSECTTDDQNSDVTIDSGIDNSSISSPAVIDKSHPEDKTVVKTIFFYYSVSFSVVDKDAETNADPNCKFAYNLDWMKFVFSFFSKLSLLFKWYVPWRLNCSWMLCIITHRYSMSLEGRSSHLLKQTMSVTMEKYPSALLKIQSDTSLCRYLME